MFSGLGYDIGRRHLSKSLCRVQSDALLITGCVWLTGTKVRTMTLKRMLIN